MTQLLNHAGVRNKLAVAQWLRQHDAQWPAALGHSSYQQWSDDVIAWARSEGCTSPIIV
jgi:hypothetical protein